MVHYDMCKMEEIKFTISTREEVERFSNRLCDYMRLYTNPPFSYPDLLCAYDYCNLRCNGDRKLFAAIVDLRITASFLFIDTNRVGIGINKQSLVSNEDVLNNQDYFNVKFNLLHENIDMVVRCRALYDKLMGVIILLCAPTSYNDFIGAKSRKKAFSNIAKSFMNEDTLSEFVLEVSRLDESYRTAEVHQTGSMRTWVFLSDSPFNEKEMGVIACWNKMSGWLSWLDKRIEQRLKSGLKDPDF